MQVFAAFSPFPSRTATSDDLRQSGTAAMKQLRGALVHRRFIPGEFRSV